MKRICIATLAALLSLCGMARAADHSVDVLRLGAADLPAGYTLGGEVRSISLQAAVFYRSPDRSGELPGPVKKAHQELLYNGETRGTLAMLQYRNGEEAAMAEGRLRELVWGNTDVPTQEHPEEIYTAGNVLFLFCFGYRSDESRMVRDFLREKKGIVLGGPEDPLTAVIAKARRYQNRRDARKGIAYLVKQYGIIRDRSLGRFFLAELYAMAGDWADAEAHYRGALGLHNGADRFRDTGPLQACHRGLGTSLAMTGRVRESVGPFTSSLELARAMKQETRIAGSAYDLACSLAVLKEFGRAHALLAEAVRLDPKYRAMARADACFRDALSEKRFADLLK